MGNNLASSYFVVEGSTRGAFPPRKQLGTSGSMTTNEAKKAKKKIKPKKDKTSSKIVSDVGFNVRVVAGSATSADASFDVGFFDIEISVLIEDTIIAEFEDTFHASVKDEFSDIGFNVRFDNT